MEAAVVGKGVSNLEIPEFSCIQLPRTEFLVFGLRAITRKSQVFRFDIIQLFVGIKEILMAVVGKVVSVLEFSFFLP